MDSEDAAGTAFSIINNYVRFIATGGVMTALQISTGSSSCRAKNAS